MAKTIVKKALWVLGMSIGATAFWIGLLVVYALTA